MTTGAPAGDRVWDKRRTAKRDRLAGARPYTDGKLIRPEALGQVLEAIIRPGDKVALEGDNQKQADFLSRTLAACHPGKLHDLHMLIGSMSRSEHLDLFEQGIATKLDFAYAGPQSVRIAQLVADGTCRSARSTPTSSCTRGCSSTCGPTSRCCAHRQADRAGQPVYRPEHRRHPGHRRGGRLPRRHRRGAGRRDRRRRAAPRRYSRRLGRRGRCKPTGRSPSSRCSPAIPRQIGAVQILQAMIAVRGIYERHQVISLNHGIGFDTAAIELILPTYGEQLGLKGKICRHWALNPHPTLIPAIESGWVEIGPQLRRRVGHGATTSRPVRTSSSPDATAACGPTGCCASSRGSTRSTCSSAPRLQMDADANSSTVTEGRLAGFGGAPNMGHDPHGRRHATPAWLDLRYGEGAGLRGRKLVVQIAGDLPVQWHAHLRRTLDAIRSARTPGCRCRP